jgi:predicted methyltransferase
MRDIKTRQSQLIRRLSDIMPRNDVETLFAAARNPSDEMARQMAQMVWDDLPSGARIALGRPLDTFIEEVGSAKAGPIKISAFEKRLARWQKQV